MKRIYAFLRHQCLDLTANGEKLSITWSSKDQPRFRVFLDQWELAPGSVRWLLMQVTKHHLEDIGLTTLSTSFSGKAVFDRETCSFKGEHGYDQETSRIEDLNILVQIPAHYWFDHVRILLTHHHSNTTMTLVELLVTNGPATWDHDKYTGVLNKHLAAMLRRRGRRFLTDKEYSSAGVLATYRRSDFIPREGWLLKNIPEILCTYKRRETSTVEIPLSSTLDTDTAES